MTLIAADASVQKLFGHWQALPVNHNLGFLSNSVSMSDKWIVAGVFGSDEGATDRGSAQVFSATTGAWVRELFAPGPATATMQFGLGCAVSGNYAVITERGKVAAHLFDLTTGKWLRTFTPLPPDNVTSGNFGWNAVIEGNRVLIGAPLADGKGAAFVFDLKTGAQLGKLTDATVPANAGLGGTVAAEGNLALLGSPSEVADRGGAWLFDLKTMALIRHLQPAGSAAGDHVGTSVALHQGRAVLGAPFASASMGKVYVVNLSDSSERTWTSSDLAASDTFGTSLSADGGMVLIGAPGHSAGGRKTYLFDLSSPSLHEFQQIVAPEEVESFGYCLALSNGNALAGSPGDDSQAADAGALFLMKSYQRPLPLSKVAVKGDYAPGGIEVNYNTFSDVLANADGELAFTSTLSGAGSNGGKDVGLFDTLSMSTPELVIKSRDHSIAGGVGVISKALINDNSHCVFRSTLVGTGINSLNNEALFADDGAGVSALFVKGSPIATGASPLMQSLTQVVQPVNSGRVVATMLLRQGVNGVTAATDSACALHDFNALSLLLREGDPATGTTEKLGQLTGRVATSYSGAFAFSAALTGAVTTNQSVHRVDGNLSTTLVARKGMNAPGIAGATITSLISESMDISDNVMFRGTLSAPATTANNEALWSIATNSTQTLVMRKGDALNGQPNVKIAKFLKLWQVIAQPLALVQLTGVGVNAGNDVALVQVAPGGLLSTPTVLLREGDVAPGCGGAMIGVISTVDVEPVIGHYLVLATLVGAPVGTDLALFRGSCSTQISKLADVSLRHPRVVLRKGQLFTNQPSKLKSITLPTSTVTASGAGNVGLGTCIRRPTVFPYQSFTPIAIVVEFDNGVRQVMQGLP